MSKLDEIRYPASSLEIARAYGIQVGYSNAARAVKNLVRRYNLPLVMRGNGKWVRVTACPTRGTGTQLQATERKEEANV